MAVRNRSDIAAIEAVPLIERNLPESTYATLVASAKRNPDAPALTFLPSADNLDATHVWTYAELVADVTRAANLFAALGVTTDRPVAFVLPNLPETHFTIWGGEAAGAALAINPMLESEADRGIVALGPGLAPGHPRARVERESVAGPGRGAGLSSRPYGDRVRRHGQIS